MTGMFDGKVAIVTGGSSGIGQAIAERLAAGGAKVAVVASSSLDKAAVVAKQIQAAGGEAKAFAVDVRDGAAVSALVAQVVEVFGGVDLLVNAAGVFYPTPIGETEAAALDAMVDINLKGPWNCINAVVPAMKTRGGGRILNVASVAGVIGVRGFALYAATKAAVIMLTRSLVPELAAHGINVNAIAPGNTATPMNASVRADPAAAEAMRKMTPSGVSFSDPADIAGIALFLLSDAARPVHGATWLADEGISAAIG